MEKYESYWYILAERKLPYLELCFYQQTGETPLHVAVSSEKKEIVHQLLAAGAKTNINNQVRIEIMGYALPIKLFQMHVPVA